MCSSPHTVYRRRPALPTFGTLAFPLLLLGSSEDDHLHLMVLKGHTPKLPRDIGHHRGLSGQQMHGDERGGPEKDVCLDAFGIGTECYCGCY
jgi:hypothetical protein